MTRRIQSAVAILFVGTALFGACSRKDKPPKYVALGEFVEAQDSFPHVRYFDTKLVSINDRCAVRKVKLNPKMPPVYVNGRPVGFC